MADIVPSLFGVTPQMYQRQQQDRMDAQALRFAQLDPFQQAQFGIARGANMLGGAIGGALGGQDPELQRITLRQQIARQLNPNDPASIQQAIAMLQQSGDADGAMMLQGEYRKLQESGALIEQRKAAAAASTAAAGRERAPPTTSELTNARAIAAAAGPEGSPEYNAAFKKEYERLTAPKDSKEPTTTELTNARTIAAQAGPVGSPEYNAAFAAEYARLTAPKEAKGPAFGTDREAVAAEVYGKPFADLTQPQKAAVNKRVEEESRAKAPKIDVRLPGEPVKPKDWMDFTQDVLSKDPVMVRTSTILSDAPAAIETIRLSASNDIAANALPGSLARLTGEGKNMSNADVARFARTGGLDDRLAQDVVKFFSGRTTNVKKEQAERFATALYRGALIERRKKLVDESEQYGYLDSPNYKTALRQIDDQLARFKLKTSGGAEKPAAAPTAGKLSDAELRKKYGVPE